MVDKNVIMLRKLENESYAHFLTGIGMYWEELAD